MFKLHTDLAPKGDQGQAIEKLSEGLSKYKYQTLLGVTGSGKTFTIANVINKVNLPTLVISPNKILAAQLYLEFKDLFPENSVEYFVSFYDYFRPEAYIPEKDIFLEKKFELNEALELLKIKAVASLQERRDIIIVASVSCLYNIGKPSNFKEMGIYIEKGENYNRRELLEKLVEIQYNRNDFSPLPGTFRARGGILEIFPAYSDKIYRIEFFDDEVEKISLLDPVTRRGFSRDFVMIYPAKHYMVRKEKVKKSVQKIKEDLDRRLKELNRQNKFVEAQRLKERVNYDIEMLKATGYCRGVENYSIYFEDRSPGEKPYSLLDYFPKDFLMVIDESHIAIPQIKGMYKADRTRKSILVRYGFRLSSCFENRPLKWEEFKGYMKKVIFMSATPGEYECKLSRIVEQLVRPTGLLEPKVSIKKPDMEDLVQKIKEKGRSLVITVTKREAEKIADYLNENDVKAEYMHSDINTEERVEIIRNLRFGKTECVVGINLLREGLDLPEVPLVAILHADKKGFLRTDTSLIQIMGRVSRNVEGEVVLYADKTTDAMKKAIKEIERRRRIQEEFNMEHGITPETIKKKVYSGLVKKKISKKEEKIQKLKEELKKAFEDLDFVKAVEIREKIIDLES
ncbi:excinuclease ABC subunit B [Thermococci archaeon]|nr:MAG: excinuclease ABC subunit B [Thermococci archaeon]RLG00164.1 MAG: excinuclease ABC subunit B [Thermococci archaeon]